MRSGYLVLRADEEQRAPITGAVFTLTQNGVLTTTTSVAPAPPSTSMRLYVDRTASHDTGVALVNPGSQSAALRFTTRDLNGIAAGSPVTSTLSGNRQKALFVSELIPTLPESFRGTLDLMSDVPVAALALRSTSSGSRFLLATLPVESLMQPPTPRVLCIPHLADGPGFNSQFVVLNMGGAAAAPKLSFLSQQGIPVRLVVRH